MERGIERKENGGQCLVNLCRTCKEIILQMTDNPRLELSSVQYLNYIVDMCSTSDKKN